VCLQHPSIVTFIIYNTTPPTVPTLHTRQDCFIRAVVVRTYLRSYTQLTDPSCLSFCIILYRGVCSPRNTFVHFPRTITMASFWTFCYYALETYLQSLQPRTYTMPSIRTLWAFILQALLKFVSHPAAFSDFLSAVDTPIANNYYSTRMDIYSFLSTTSFGYDTGL
jgi:hypothetical protein